MSHVSRIGMLLALVLSLALLGCQREKEDVLAENEPEDTEEVVVDDTTSDEAEGEAGDDVAPAEEEPTEATSEDGEEPADDEPVTPSTPESADESSDAEVAEEEPSATPEEQETTVAVGEEPEATPTVEEEADDGEEEATVAEDQEEAAAAEDGEEEAATESETEASSEASADAADGTYIVQSGDTLFSIAQRHNTSVDQLRALNSLTTNYVFVGQELQVAGSAETQEAPASGSAGQVHVVQTGEWLWSIARQYNTTPSAIKRANGLTGDIVYQGQRLAIPGQGAAASNGNAQTHTVGRGETLFSIASRYGTSVQAIRTQNALSSDTIYVGQELVIP